MQKANEKSLTPMLQLQLYLITGFILLPHVNNLTLAISAYLFLLLGLRLASLKFPALQPNKLLLFLLTGVGVYLIFSQHQTIMGKDAGISLLSIMLVLKTLEVRRRRDIYITVFISYFVIITQFLFNQTFILFVYQLILLLVITSLILNINRAASADNPINAFKSTVVISIQALPIALILFVMFPRLNQPLWNIGFDNSAQSGISDQIRPGSISQLIQSSEVAFRASFDQPPPARETFYWRGLVLWDTDGITWFTDKEKPIEIRTAQVSSQERPVKYEIFLEPHRNNWLYSLDIPASHPIGSKMFKDFTVFVKDPVIQPKQYEIQTYLKYSHKELPGNHRKRATRLPDNITDRQRELVSIWKSKADTDAQIVQLGLDYFNQNSFIYTLNPPAYLDNPIDQFLFEQREGFCGHYATAFTQLMRLAEIPTRIVVGYQGGEYNELGDYFTIRQYDAHAWTEVWLQNEGWRRVDPTAAVAPERVSNAIQTNIGGIGAPAMFRIDESGWIGGGIRQLGMLLDTTGLQWRLWVLGFDREKQFSVMKGLGFDFLDIKYRGLLSIIFIAAVLAVITLYTYSQTRLRLDPVVKHYRDFCNRLANLGYPKLNHEGPLDYSKRIIQARPDLSRNIEEITQIYISLRYGHPNIGELKNFARQVRAFRPSRRAR